MTGQNPNKRSRRARRARPLRVEALENRALLAASTVTITGRPLAGLIQQAQQGKQTASAVINRMLTTLETQLTSGPLADLITGKVNGNGFVVEAQILEARYEQDVDQQHLPQSRTVNPILKMEGQRIVADLVSLNQQSAAGLTCMPGPKGQEGRSSPSRCRQGFCDQRHVFLDGLEVSLQLAYGLDRPAPIAEGEELEPVALRAMGLVERHQLG